MEPGEEAEEAGAARWVGQGSTTQSGNRSLAVPAAGHPQASLPPYWGMGLG